MKFSTLELRKSLTLRMIVNLGPSIFNVDSSGFIHCWCYGSCFSDCDSVLQIRRDERDNLGIIFQLTPLKRML